MSEQDASEAAIREWLASPEGEAWSRQTFAPVGTCGFGLFASLLPVPWGKPFRSGVPQ